MNMKALAAALLSLPSLPVDMRWHDGKPVAIVTATFDVGAFYIALNFGLHYAAEA